MVRTSSAARARLLVAVLLAGAVLAAPDPAGAQFTTFETRDLRMLHLEATQGVFVPHIAQCYHNSLGFYRRVMGWEPSEPVHMYIEDTGDFGNAGVWCAPRNSMMVQIAPTSFVYETAPSNERIYFLMNHELAHVATLDMATGRDRFFRTLFRGKVPESAEHPETIVYDYLTLPRRRAPRWHREGAATFFETWMAGGYGRVQGPYDEMVFRAMVRDSAHFYDPLGLEAEGVRVDFQIGVNAYLYGTRFMTYMAWRDTPEKLVEWVQRRPGSKPYFASQFAHVYGRPLKQAWREWIEWEHGFQRANLDSVRRHPVTTGRDLSREALGSVSNACLDDSAGVLYAGVNYPGTLPYLAAIPLDGGPIRRLRDVKGPSLYSVTSIAFDPGARRLFYTTDNNDWRDLLAFDLATGRTRVLMKDARVGDLAFNRADSSLWGVRRFNGISTVVRLTPPYRDYQRVFSFPYGRDPYDLDISPDGTRLVASVPEVNGRQYLRVMSVPALMRGDTTSRALYDFGSSIPNGFVFSRDGRALYGSSYYTGVSNIFRYDLVADSMDVLTNAETGFFRPVPLGGDSLVAFRYTGRGFQPVMIADRPVHDVSAITFLGYQLVERYPVLKTWQVPSPRTVDLAALSPRQGPYRPARRIGVANAFPVIEGYKAYAAPGLHLDLSDPFGFHRIGITAGVTPQEEVPDDERWHVSADYRHFRLGARFRYNGASFYDLFGPTRSSRKGYSLGLDYDRTLIRDTPRTLDLKLSVTGHAGLERLPEAQNVATSAGFDKLVAPTFELAYKHTRSSLGSVDTEKGHTWRIQGSVNTVRFERPEGAEWRGFPMVAGAADVGVPLPAPHTSVWIRTAGGYSPGDPDEPFANFFFGGFGNNWVDRQDPRRYRSYESFPGIEIDGAGGTDFGRALVEVNLPPLRFRRLGTLDFYAAWARTSVFAGGLVTDVSRDATRRRLADVGVQTDFRLSLMIQQPLTLSFAWARAFERHATHDDEWMVSLKIL